MEAKSSRSKKHDRSKGNQFTNAGLLQDTQGLLPQTCEAVSVNRLPRGTRILLQTANRVYAIETSGGFDVTLRGHPEYCPEAVTVYVRGSRRPRLPLEPGLIRCGARIDFWNPARGIITTSIVRCLQLYSAEHPWSVDLARAEVSCRSLALPTGSTLSPRGSRIRELKALCSRIAVEGSREYLRHMECFDS